MQACQRLHATNTEPAAHALVLLGGQHLRMGQLAQAMHALQRAVQTYAGGGGGGNGGGVGDGGGSGGEGSGGCGSMRPGLAMDVTAVVTAAVTSVASPILTMGRLSAAARAVSSGR